MTRKHFASYNFWATHIIAFCLISGMLLLTNSCRSPDANSRSLDNVVFDASFPGARLSKLEKIDKDHFKAIILPEFEPVNKSPWFAFSIVSEKQKEIHVTLSYGKYQHRYIPKLSHDRKIWKRINDSKIQVDTITGEATLTLPVSKKKLFVAAQEITSSADTYRWVDSILILHPSVQRSVAGKTVNGKDNYVLALESEDVHRSIVLVARQHPPEIPGGTIAFKYFYETLLEDNKVADRFRKAYNIYTFPLLNPDGTDMGTWRHNANGKDLNRDWVDFSQPETQMVKTYLDAIAEKGVEINFGVDFHTSYSGPYLLILDSLNAQQSKGYIDKWIKNIESNSEFTVEARRRSQDLPYCYNWFFNHFKAEAVTYEDGDEVDRNVVAERARQYAQSLMEILLNDPQ